MSEHVLKILLSELTVAQVVCQGVLGGEPCGHVYEMPIAALETFHKKMPECPFCHTPFGVWTAGAAVAEDGFAPLVKSLTALNAAGRHFQVRFVLPEKKQP